MNRSLRWIWCLLPLLYGCPYTAPYAIDPQPMMEINQALVGKWATFVTKVVNDKISREEPVKIIFSARSDREYDIAITGYLQELQPYRVIDQDTIHGTGYLSMIQHRVFLNALIKSRYYIAEVQESGGKFSLFPLRDGFTAKHVKSSADVRTAIGYHFATRVTPAFAEEFILRNLQRVN